MAVSVVVVMGVAGAGKSTVARRLADELGWDFADGDDFHAAASVAKMAAGEPLTDAERGPWLADIAAWIDAEIAAGRSGVVACSALRRTYRDALRRPEVLFAYLCVPRAVLERRLTGRTGHFMPATLLKSQLAALEPPADDEQAVVVDAGEGATHTLEQIRERLAAAAGPGPSA
jgi:carbohydrate kinase (thermoresistant glucokinase family)